LVLTLFVTGKLICGEIGTYFSINLRFQSIYRTDADYDRTLNSLQLSKDIKFGYQTQKGLLVFSLKIPSSVKLQLSRMGKLNVYHNSFTELTEVLITLKKVFMTETGNSAHFELLKIVPSREELIGRLMNEPYDPVRSLNVKFLAPLIEKGWIAEE